MKEKSAWERFSNLPPEAQKQVLDFIAFLQERYAPARTRKSDRRTKLSKESFIGMWRDRADLQDSTQWVRNTRKHEWQDS